MLFDEVQVVLTRIESQHGHLVAPLLDPVLLLGGEKLEIIRKISLTNDFSYRSPCLRSASTKSSTSCLVSALHRCVEGFSVSPRETLVCHRERPTWVCAQSRR